MGYVHFDERGVRDERFRILRDAGFSLRAIASAYGCSHETVREALDPALKARRNARRLARYHERQASV